MNPVDAFLQKYFMTSHDSRCAPFIYSVYFFKHNQSRKKCHEFEIPVNVCQNFRLLYKTGKRPTKKIQTVESIILYSIDWFCQFKNDGNAVYDNQPMVFKYQMINSLGMTSYK
jgi:hypothetical protein